MNLSRGQLLFEEMRKRWYTRKLQDEFEMTHYFRVNGSCLFVSPSKFTFIAWIQPPLSLIYLLFLIFVIYIFAKEKMFGFLQGIIVFANALTVIPMSITAPIIIVFFNFANLSEPMPYPWCYMYLVLDVTLPKTTRMVVLYLKILLSINRVCSVYYPFQTRRWFTKKRIILYCVVVFSLSLASSSYVYFNPYVIVEAYFGAVWPDGDISTYHVCSTKTYKFTGTNSENFILRAIELAINIIGFILLLVFNVIFVIKLKKRQKERRILTNNVISEHTKKTENRIDRMNKISGYILYGIVFIEIPRFINEIITLQYYARILVNELTNTEKKYTEAEKCIDNILDLLVRIIITCTLSLDLIIFLVMSTKMKKAIKELIYPSTCIG